MNQLPGGGTTYPYTTPISAGSASATNTVTPTVVTGGGYTQPDWSGLLNTYLQPYQSIYDAQMKAFADRVAAQSQLAQNRFQGSDTSTMARLLDTHNQNVRDINHALAARGLFNSGDQPFQQEREALGYKRAQTDASNQLLDYLTGLQSQLADQRFQGLLGLQNQRMSLASTLGSLYQPTVNPYTFNVPGTTAAPALSFQVPGGTVEAY